MVLSPEEIGDFRKGKIDSLFLGAFKTLEGTTNSILAQYYIPEKPIHFSLGNLQDKEIQDITIKFSKNGWYVEYTVCEKYGLGYFSFSAKPHYNVININSPVYTSLIRV